MKAIAQIDHDFQERDSPIEEVKNLSEMMQFVRTSDHNHTTDLECTGQVENIIKGQILF